MTAVLLGSVFVASQHRASWVDVGLVGIVILLPVVGGLAKVFTKLGVHGRFVLWLMLILFFGFIAFWLYCIVVTTTGSWIWATVAAVLGGYLSFDYFAYRMKKRSAATPATSQADNVPNDAI